MTIAAAAKACLAGFDGDVHRDSARAKILARRDVVAMGLTSELIALAWHARRRGSSVASAARAESLHEASAVPSGRCWHPAGSRSHAPAAQGDAPEKPAALRWRVPDGPLPMWIFDRATGAILAANPAAERAYGYAVGELLARRVHDICLPDARGRSLASTAQRLDVAEEPDTFLQRRRDGSVFEAEVTTLVAGVDQLCAATMVLVQPQPRSLLRLRVSESVAPPVRERPARSSYPLA